MVIGSKTMTLREYSDNMQNHEYMDMLMTTLRELSNEGSIADHIDALFPELPDQTKMRISVLIYCMDIDNIKDILHGLGIV